VVGPDRFQRAEILTHLSIDTAALAESFHASPKSKPSQWFDPPDKPLKRFDGIGRSVAGLKPGVNRLFYYGGQLFGAGNAVPLR
jgi:hypothetical protein